MIIGKGKYNMKNLVFIIAFKKDGQLKKEFLDFGTITTFLENFSGKVSQQSSQAWDVSKDLFTAAIAGSMFDLLGPVGAGLALKAFAKSDLKQKMIVLTQIEKASVKVPDFISQSVKSYMKKGKKLKKLKLL